MSDREDGGRTEEDPWLLLLAGEFYDGVGTFIENFEELVDL